MIAFLLFLTLTWTDNANNEEGFYILRKAPGASTYVLVATVGPNVQRYRDQRPKWWENYCYMVASFNGNEGNYSNEACNSNI